jgi:ADP-heptose:LPS heptosyltransferase
VSSLAGCVSLGEALCLFRRARLMISCDSGPLHAAAALGTPVVALFGPTLPEHTGPWGPGHRVVQASRPTHHHAYRRDHGRQYMGALGVQAVADAVQGALRATATAAATPR